MRCRPWRCFRRRPSIAAVDVCDSVGNFRSPGVGAPSCRSKSLAVGSFRPPSVADTSFCVSDSSSTIRAGYPGSLTPNQLHSYQEFRRRILSDPDNTYLRMIRCFGRAVETEEHAICRYLRARKFNVDATIQMMSDRSQLWREGATHNFYPNFKDALGTAAIPESVFASQLQLVLGHVTKSSSPIMYFSAGRVRADGLECLAPFGDIHKYVWHLVIHKLPRHIAYLSAKSGGRTVPIEMLVLADLGGISLNSLRRTLKALEEAMRVLNVFPEVLSHVVLVNVPQYFMPFWPVIKSFVDKDTAEKFELFANEERGRQRLLELVESDKLASDYGGTGQSTERLMLEQCESSAKAIRKRQVGILSCRRGSSSVLAEGSVSVQAEEFVSLRVYAGARGRSARVYVDIQTRDGKKRIQLLRDDKGQSHTILYAQVAGCNDGDIQYRIKVERGKGGVFVHAEHFLWVIDVRTFKR